MSNLVKLARLVGTKQVIRTSDRWTVLIDVLDVRTVWGNDQVQVSQPDTDARWVDADRLVIREAVRS